MTLISGSIARPVTVLAVVILVCLAGWLSLQAIPVQMAPDIARPVIEIDTGWPGAAPAEVEREIVNRQEDVLKGIPGLASISSSSGNGRASIDLEFELGTDMDRALLLVSNRLDQVGGYPEEVDEPTLYTAGSEDNPIARYMLRALPGSDVAIAETGLLVEEVLQEALERVDGVGRVEVFGALTRELRIVIQPERLAFYGLTVPDVLATLRGSNAAVPGGDLDEGKRTYVVRTEGELTTPEDVRAVAVRTDRDPATGRVARVLVGDVAEVGFGYPEPTALIRYNGQPAISIAVLRETGANVIQTMAEVTQTVADLNAGPLARQNLEMVEVYDETVYIEAAINLVLENLMLGGLLAAAVLLLFLRSARATLVIAVAIPVSLIGSFVAMSALGRSLNVISLAGLAFAVGMVVDAAIVVLENIYRKRLNGQSPAQAAYQGAATVWSAVLVSALTTVMVFLPILVLELEVAQLFRDIAVALSVSVMLSLVVAITLIPALSSRLLGRLDPGKPPIALPGLDPIGRGFTAMVARLAGVLWDSKLLSMIAVIAVTTLSVVVAVRFMPKLEYLPEGNRNFVFGSMQPPPGYNLATANDIAARVEGGVRDLWVSVSGADAPADGPPKISHFFFISRGAGSFFGAAAEPGERVKELIPVMQRLMFTEPGTFGFVRQPSLFGRGIGGGRTIDLDIAGPDLEALLETARRAQTLVNQVLPRDQGTQVRPRPGLELGAPEIRIIPDRMRLADAGLSARDLGQTVDAFNDGLRVAEISVDGRRIDLVLSGPPRALTRTQDIGALPIVTRTGTILPVSALATVDDKAAGPIEIRHKERRRTVTLQISPTTDIALESAMELLETQVIAPLRSQGLPQGVSLRLSGTADQLTETFSALSVNLLISIFIVYLVMAVLFESFLYPVLIIATMPLAAAGGLGALALLNLFVAQPLDMLTMLGFVILVGTVVNNAILVVDQTLYHLREDRMDRRAALIEATRNRVRPIFMSQFTTLLGMAPLVLFPGPGSELYRGLGTVVLGGLAFSTVLTLVVMPALLSLTLVWSERDPHPVDETSDGFQPGAGTSVLDLYPPRLDPARLDPARLPQAAE